MKSLNTMWRMAFFTFLAWSLVLLGGCASVRNYGINKDFDKTKYKRIGLLVFRVGNYSSGVIAPILPETDYSNKVPKRELSAGSLYMKEHKDVMMEDDAHLREAFPDYPRIRNPFGIETFYKNITPQVYKVLEACLIDKGYKVTDVTDISRSWRKPVSEMTIKEIVSQVRDHVDALFVCHYMDIATQGTLSALMYNFSMFDVSSNESVLYFNSYLSPSMLDLISEDPSVPPEKITKRKVSERSREEAESTLWKIRVRSETYLIQAAMSEEEIVQYALKYMRFGFPKEWQGIIKPKPALESLIP